MPTATTLSNGSPAADVAAPRRTSSTKAKSRSRTSQDAAMASSTGTKALSAGAFWEAAPRGARSAVCSTARRSDELMRSPRRICSTLRGTSMRRASLKRSRMVLSSTFWRVQSRKTPTSAASSDISATRCSLSRSLRRCVFSTLRAWRDSLRHSSVSVTAPGPSRSPKDPKPDAAPARASSNKPRPISRRCVKMPSSISSWCNRWKWRWPGGGATSSSSSAATGDAASATSAVSSPSFSRRKS